MDKIRLIIATVALIIVMTFTMGQDNKCESKGTQIPGADKTAKIVVKKDYVRISPIGECYYIGGVVPKFFTKFSLNADCKMQIANFYFT